MSGALVEVEANRLRVRAPRRLGGLAGRGAYSNEYFWSGTQMTGPGRAAFSVSAGMLAGAGSEAGPHTAVTDWTILDCGLGSRRVLFSLALSSALLWHRLCLSPLLAPRLGGGRLSKARLCLCRALARLSEPAVQSMLQAPAVLGPGASSEAGSSARLWCSRDVLGCTDRFRQPVQNWGES